MAVDVVVDYQWKRVHHVNSRSANHKSSRKNMPAQQDVASKNLTPGDSLAGSGNPLSLDGHHAGDNALCLNLGHAVNSTSEQEASDANHKFSPSGLFLELLELPTCCCYDPAREAHCADDGFGALMLLLNMLGGSWFYALLVCYFMLKLLSLLKSLLKQGLDASVEL
ncbi:hypothetical protein Nepgr_007980 [Nepenthes gracilis]|uniref:Uncharacterized protein n=1 Tax=Nepenthes gracilis TaxID=150966 RepID=A0AAD3S7Z0_NEPGR|nr:hypothetical protein Nepgr_007980 [Nepenthes gracilis]